MKEQLVKILEEAFMAHHSDLFERDEHDALDWCDQMGFFDARPADPNIYIPNFLKYCSEKLA